ncbi:MAG: squalene/phytoene synthase family protein [Gammaproteobacteria bacterium]|nr:squalene/phytoene synthase family protein [Gammaproteobacteria bacterium]
MQAITFPNAATTLGSSAYYVSRFSPVDIRDNLAVLFLWKQELLELYALSDPGVARMKLQWWQEQIFLPVDNPSAHALAHNLFQLIQQDTTLSESVKTMIKETDRHLHRQPYRDIDEFRQGCENFGGSFARLINTVSSCRTETRDLVVGSYAIAAEWLQLMGQHIRYNIRLIPQTMLDINAIRFEELLYENKQQQTREILKQLYMEIENKSTLPAPKRSSSPLYKYYRLRKKMMDLLLAEDFDVLDQKISLTPIRKLWFAL